MSQHSSKEWALDGRLEGDTFLIAANEAWQTRLMNDRRWPWVIVVPVGAGAEDIEDLDAGSLGALVQHLARISAALKAMKVCTSTNVATLGNVVKQMHWHVVGRSEGDANWPAPVWGFEKALPYGRQDADRFISDLRKALSEEGTS